MAEVPFNIVKREDLAPVCPHCNEELTEVFTKAKGVALIQGTSVVYFCPHCGKVLGFGHGRMI
jgi:uncharacterized protein with PIN domain